MTNHDSNVLFKYWCLFAVCCLLTFSGCDDSFQPLQENDKYYFSIYGYLDAAADTQWVRVGPTRQDINDPPDPEEIQVTLEDLQSRETVVMNDSVFTSRNVLNYWTTMDIKNEQTYRITATRADGKSSQVTVIIPMELQTPVVLANNVVPRGLYIYINDSVEHVADIQTKWYVLFNPKTEKLKKTYTFSYRNTIKHTGAYGGANFAFANTTEERRHITENNGNAEIDVLYRQIFIAAGGPEWNENISSINDLEYFLDGTASNVENGLGYVVGIDSKWLPYKSCLNEDGSNIVPCEPEEPFW